MQQAVFGRSEEVEGLRQRLVARQTFLLHGSTGVGKTLLLLHIAPQFPEMLYSPQNVMPQMMYGSLSKSLLAAGHPVLAKACPNGIASLLAKSAICVRGLVREALRDSKYMVVVDHLTRPSQALAGCLRELMQSCSVPVIAVARSVHMEDAGFVLPLFPDRAARVHLRNFGPEMSRQFAAARARTEGLKARNLAQFLERVVDYSEGNPGAMLQMIHLATQPRYCTEDQIKIAPLYIDYKLATVSPPSGAG